MTEWVSNVVGFEEQGYNACYNISGSPDTVTTPLPSGGSTAAARLDASSEWFEVGMASHNIAPTDLVVASNFWFGFKWRCADTTPASTTTILEVRDGNDVVALSFQLQTDGDVDVLDSNGSSVGVITAPFTDNTYHTIQCWLDIGASTTQGDLKVFIDKEDAGDPDLNVTSQDFAGDVFDALPGGNAQCHARLRFIGIDATSIQYVDDVVCWMQRGVGDTWQGHIIETGPWAVLGYQGPDNGTTSDEGDNLDAGSWSDINAAPPNASTADFTNSAARSGNVYFDSSPTGGLIQGPNGDTDLLSKIEACMFCLRASRGNGSGTTHQFIYGSRDTSGSPTTVTRTITFQDGSIAANHTAGTTGGLDGTDRPFSSCYDRARGAECPDLTDWAVGGFAKSSGGRQIFVSHMHMEVFTRNEYAPRVNHWRGYNDDGTEATGTPIAAEDTNFNVNIGGGDVIIVVRYLIEETGGAGSPPDQSPWPSTFEIYRKINAGSFAEVTSSTTGVQEAGIGNSGLTQGAATTNRGTNGLTDPGGGTFTAGKQWENNFGNYYHPKDTFTEHAFALKIVAADLSATDTVELELRFQNVAMTQTPSNLVITITSSGATKDLDASVSQSLSVNARQNVLRPLDGSIAQALTVSPQMAMFRGLDAALAQSLTMSPEIDVNEIIELDNSSTTGAGTGNLSWTHSPNGFLRAIVVAVVYNDRDDPNQVSAVTYGGESLARMNGSPFSSIAGTEEGTVDCWWLVGASIGALPAGDQTIVVTVTSGATKKAFGVGIRSTRDLTVVNLNKRLDGTVVANPSSTLALHNKLCLVFQAFMSGHADVANTTPPAGWTSDAEEVLVAELAGLYTYDTKDTADVTIGWTQTSDDALALAYALGPTDGLVDLDGLLAQALSFSSDFGFLKSLDASAAMSLSVNGRLGAFRPIDSLVSQSLAVNGRIGAFRPLDALIATSMTDSAWLALNKDFNSLIPQALSVNGRLSNLSGIYGSIDTALTVSARLNAFRPIDSAISSSLSFNADMSRLRSIDANIAQSLSVASQLDVFIAGGFVELDSSVGASLSFAGNLGTLLSIDASIGMTSGVSAFMGPLRGLSSNVQSSLALDGSLGVFRGLETNIARALTFNSDVGVFRGLDTNIAQALTFNADVALIKGFVSQVATALTVNAQLDPVAAALELAAQIASAMSVNSALDQGTGFSSEIQSSLMTNADLNVLRDFDAQFIFNSSVNARLGASIQINALVNTSLAFTATLNALIGIDGDIQCSLIVQGDADRLIGLSAQVDFVCTSSADASCIIGMWGSIDQALSVLGDIDGLSDTIYDIGTASVRIVQRGKGSFSMACGSGATVGIGPRVGYTPPDGFGSGFSSGFE